jgi:lipoprotein NlpD
MKTASVQNLTVITGNSYTVEPGDTLFAIAFYSGNDYRELAKINNIPSPFTIQVGQTLRLNAQTASRINSANTNDTRSGKEKKAKQKYVETGSKIRRQAQPDTQSNSNKSNRKLAWMWPAQGSRTIATVGSDGSKRGLDIKGRLGSTVVAAADGKVVYAGNALKGYGNLVIIKHNDDYLSAYAHNKSNLVGEQVYVKQGQQIATMGSSGASDVMLHFEIRLKGKSVDPFKYLPAQ